MTTQSRAKPLSGWVLFAASFLMILGVFNVLYGLIILFNDDAPVLSAAGAVAMEIAVWGWVIIAIGALEVSAGYSILTGRSWAQYFGIIVGAFGIVSGLLTIEVNTLWGIFAVVINTALVYGLTVHGDEIGYDPGRT